MSPGKNDGVGYHFLLHGIFLTQGLIEALSLVSPALAGELVTTVPPGKLSLNYICYYAFLYLVSLFYQTKHTPNSAFQHATLDPPHTVS